MRRLEHAAKLAGRVSGDSTVAYAHRVRSSRRGGARHRGSAARAIPARADGRAGASRQSLRRHRRHLQRRVVLADARPLRRPARARPARRRRLLRASADDGSRRAGRRAADLAQGRQRHPRVDRRTSPALSGAGGALRQHGVAAGPHGHDGHREAPSWRASTVPAAMSAAPPAAPSMRAVAAATRPTRSLASTCPCAARATSMRACGSASRGRAEPGADRADPGPVAAGPVSRRCARRSGDGGMRGDRARRRVSRRRTGLGAAWGPTARSRVAICAIRRGSNGRCWRRPSRATSLPTSRSATNRSTAPTRGTISERMRRCASSCSRACCSRR